eukprot:g56143.t1
MCRIICYYYYDCSQVLNVRKSGPSRLFIFEFDATAADALLDRELEDWSGKLYTLETRRGPRAFTLHRLHEGGGLAVSQSRPFDQLPIKAGDQLPIANTEVMGVVVPFFNEGYEALQRTLTSLAACQRCCNDPKKTRMREPRIQLKVLLVADGWLNQSESMLRYLQTLFPVNFDFTESVHHSRPRDAELGPLHTSTMVLETSRLTPIPDSFCELEYSRVLDSAVTADSRYSLDLTLLINSENRTRPNAHDWFFQAFMRENTFAQLALCTEAGTYFARGALLKLARFMRRHPSCIASTGRQRVMPFRLQTKAEMDRTNVFNQYFRLQNNDRLSFHEDIGSAFYRAVQKFEHEVSLACFMGGFSTAGMLPKIPGPCGLFRYRQRETGDHPLVEQAMEVYFEKVYASGDQLGIADGNLVLAADRVLSTAVAVRPDQVNLTRDIYTAWEPTAVFFFEAETEPEVLLPQRRRWHNGSLFSYFWLYGNLSYFGRGQFLQKFLVLAQLVTFFLKLSIDRSIGRMRKVGFTFQVLYAVAVLLWMVASSFRQAVMLKWLYSINAVMNALVIIVITSSFVYLSVKNFALSSVVGILVTLGPVTLVAFTPHRRLPILGPLKQILAPDGEVWLASPALCFWLYLPTFVSTLPLYALARTWDLSWGTRDTVTVGHDSSDALKQQNLAKAQAGLAGLVTLNMVLILLAMGQPVQAYSEVELFFVAVILFAFILVQLVFSLFYWVLWYWGLGIWLRLADKLYVLWAFCVAPSRGLQANSSQQDVAESLPFQRNIMSWHDDGFGNVPDLPESEHTDVSSHSSQSSNDDNDGLDNDEVRGVGEEPEEKAILLHESWSSNRGRQGDWESLNNSIGRPRAKNNLMLRAPAAPDPADLSMADLSQRSRQVTSASGRDLSQRSHHVTSASGRHRRATSMFAGIGRGKAHSKVKPLSPVTEKGMASSSQPNLPVLNESKWSNSAPSRTRRLTFEKKQPPGGKNGKTRQEEDTELQPLVTREEDTEFQPLVTGEQAPPEASTSALEVEAGEMRWQEGQLRPERTTPEAFHIEIKQAPAVQTEESVCIEDLQTASIPEAELTTSLPTSRDFEMQSQQTSAESRGRTLQNQSSTLPASMVKAQIFGMEVIFPAAQTEPAVSSSAASVKRRDMSSKKPVPVPVLPQERKIGDRAVGQAPVAASIAAKRANTKGITIVESGGSEDGTARPRGSKPLEQAPVSSAQSSSSFPFRVMSIPERDGSRNSRLGQVKLPPPVKRKNGGDMTTMKPSRKSLFLLIVYRAELCLSFAPTRKVSSLFCAFPILTRSPTAESGDPVFKFMKL